MTPFITRIDQDGRLTEVALAKKYPKELLLECYRWILQFSMLDSELADLRHPPVLANPEVPSSSSWSHLFPPLYSGLRHSITVRKAPQISLFLNQRAIPMVALGTGSIYPILESLFFNIETVSHSGGQAGFFLHQPMFTSENGLAAAVGHVLAETRQSRDLIACCFVSFDLDGDCSRESLYSLLQLVSQYQIPMLIVDIPGDHQSRRVDDRFLKQLLETVTISSIDFFAILDETVTAISSLSQQPRPLLMRFVKPPPHLPTSFQPGSNSEIVFDPSRIPGMNPAKRARFFLRRYELLSESEEAKIVQEVRAHLKTVVGAFTSAPRALISEAATSLLSTGVPERLAGDIRERASSRLQEGS